MRANHNGAWAASGLTLLLAACGGGSGGNASDGSPPPAQSRAVPQSDAEIAALLYSDSARTPPGFYVDSPPPTSGYVTTSHLKNTDLAAAPAQYELCTDDWSAALDWSETIAVNTAPYADLVATDSNTRYFEFGRVPRGQLNSYRRSRVYRCAYLDRTAVDLLGPGPQAGQLNRRPLTAGDLRELSEYLWQFTAFNNFGSAVLSSSGRASTTQIEHTLHIAQLQRAAAAGGCDRIEVLAWRHSVDVASGALTRARQILWTFGARQAGGGTELCAL